MRKMAAPLSFLPSLVLVGTAFAFSWTVGTTKPDAEGVIRDLIASEHRRACGDDNFSHSGQLRAAARYKAQDMGYRDRFGHALIDGSRVFGFYDEAGIDKSHGAGEIIAVNNFPDDESPVVAFTGWMGSDSHRAAIRNCDYDRFGVGAFKTSDPDAAGTTKWYAVEFTNISPP